MSEVEKLKGTPGPLVPRLQLLVFELVKRFEINKPLTRALFQAMLGTDAALAAHAASCWRNCPKRVLPLVHRAQENGEIRKDMPAEMLAQQAFQSYFGTLIIWSMEDGDEPLDTRMTMTFELFFKGIAPQ